MSKPRYTDFTDFILGITEEIWERRQIHSLRELYSDDIRVRSPEGIVEGNAPVINATMATLAEFPDRQLLGEDVIWERVSESGWYSSHRILSTATHAASGRYGKASSRRLRYRIIAGCHAVPDETHGWRINDEWLIRDQGAIVRQIGQHPRDFVLRSGVRNFVFNQSNMDGSYTGKGTDSEAACRYSSLLERMMAGEFSVIQKEYDRSCQLHLPGGRTEHGRVEADCFWLGLRSAFPDASFNIWHRVGRSDPECPQRAAIMWVLDGVHSGSGLFGEPTGRSAQILGMSQAEFGPRGIRAEYSLFDELAVWSQLVGD